MLIIGEKINATSNAVGEAIRERNSLFIQNLARVQVAAGADYLDVNAGTGQSSIEQAIKDMEWLIESVQEAVEVPLVVDSDDPKVIEAGLRKYRGKTPIINSLNAGKDKLNSLAPLAREYNASVIALAMGEAGIPSSVEERIVACDMIVEGLNTYDIPPQRILFDPLVLPISVDIEQGIVTLKTLERIKAKYPQAKSTLGLSNISYRLPLRKVINRGFLLMVIYAGIDSIIIDPLDTKLVSLIKVGEMLMGRDPYCKEYHSAYRKGILEE
jgi:5-methyltetrahydrofolate--homocysteine methyltransferase